MARPTRFIPRSPQGLLAGGFAALIAVGTALLWAPVSHHGDVGALEALFTATSAVCVTGLIVVDTGTAFTAFGQVVILALIQLGGLGIMTFAALGFRLFGARLSLRAQAALDDALFQRDLGTRFRQEFGAVVRLVAVLELAGAVLLFFGFLPGFAAGEAAFVATFHSVSAFCNAGFSLFPDSLTGFRADLAVMGPVTALIILGGLGHPVLTEVWHLLSRQRRVPRGVPRLSLHTRVVLHLTVVLLAAGTVGLLLFGAGTATVRPASLGTALFQSVSARTAGFNTVDIGALPAASLFLLVVLMFIGGSPGSCAGGIKTTTFGLWLANLAAWLRGEKGPRLLGRFVPGVLVRRAALILGLAVAWNILGLFVLLTTDGTPGTQSFLPLLFEQISAFGTVGLSTGVTASLSAAGRVWLIATMFFGRLGPLTLALWMFQRKDPGVRYPEGKVMIG